MTSRLPSSDKALRGSLYLGLDLGASGVKALVIDEAQRVRGEAVAPLQVSHPAFGHAEQNPRDWWAAARRALADLADAIGPLDGVAGIGLSGQMHGATLIGADHAPLHPCLLWNDTRAARKAACLDADPRFRALTGSAVFPGFTAPKIAWLREHAPNAFAKTAHILLPKDTLRLWMTGEAVSDLSDASGTGWLDVGARDWSDVLLDAMELERARLPRLVEGTTVSGVLTARAAMELGLPAGVPVAGGAGDNAASAVGVGALGDGDALISLGTSGVVFAATSAHRPDPASGVHAFCHAVPDAWHQMGVVLSAMGSLAWLARLTGQSPADLARAAQAPDAASVVRFLPYLSGERTPHNDAAVRGAFLHLDQADGAPQLARAVLDGIAFALADNARALTKAGTPLGGVVAVGGGTRAAYLMQRLADVTGRAIDVPSGAGHGAAFGAARLGLIAATGEASETIATRPPAAHTIEPAPDSDARERHEAWRALYPAVKTL